MVTARGLIEGMEVLSAQGLKPMGFVTPYIERSIKRGLGQVYLVLEDRVSQRNAKASGMGNGQGRLARVAARAYAALAFSVALDFASLLECTAL